MIDFAFKRSIRGVDWAPNSPDLTPCDFFLHGFVKQKLYSPPPPTLHHIEQKAEQIFDELNNQHVAVIQRSVLHMKKRARQCLRAMGGYFEGRRV